MVQPVKVFIGAFQGFILWWGFWENNVYEQPNCQDKNDEIYISKNLRNVVNIANQHFNVLNINISNISLKSSLQKSAMTHE